MIEFLNEKDLKSSREVMELQLPPIFKYFIFLVVLLLLSGLLWAVLGEIEIIAKASALLRPLSNVSTVKSPITGAVRRKQYENGAVVKKGEPLIRIDDEAYQSDLITSQKQLARTMGELKTSQAYLAYLADYSTKVSDPDALGLVSIFQASLTKLRLDAAQADRNLLLQRTLPEASKSPFKLAEAEMALTIANNSLAIFPLQERQKMLERTNQLQAGVDSQEKYLANLKKQIEYSEIVASIDGKIEEIQKLNTGDMLMTGEEIFRITPPDSGQLKVELSLPSNQVAEITSGMPFRLLYPKLPPSQYGNSTGTLTSVPTDAWIKQSSTPFFLLEGKLDSNFLTDRKGERVYLKAGMDAEARIVVKKKPIWFYVLEKLDYL